MDENLWSLAATKFSEKEKELLLDLDLEKPALNELLESVNQKKREFFQQQRSVNIGGRKVVLRDIFAKVAVWIQKFVDVGDAVVSYDPGHAALPWAGVRLLLKLSIRNINQRSTLLDGMEQVSKAITYYCIVERLCLYKTKMATQQLRESIELLYFRVLRFIVKAKEIYLKPISGRFLGGMFEANNNLQLLLDEIRNQEAEVKRYMELIEAEVQRDTTHRLMKLSLGEQKRHENLNDALLALQQPINRMEDQFRSLKDGLENDKRVAILHWVSPIPFIQHHNQARRDVLRGSVQWFLSDEQLGHWQTSSCSSIMWLHGSPGTGKSKLVSIFVEQLLAQSAAGKNPDPLFFYCIRNPAEPERAQSEPILRSLVRQMAYPRRGDGLLEPIKTLYEERRKDGFPAGALTLDESTALILELTRHRPLTVILVDGLDECEPNARDDLIDAFSNIIKTSSSLVKILISSRDARIITHQLSEYPDLTISANKNEGDIHRFIDEEVDDLIKRKRLLSGNVPNDLKQQIKDVLRSQAQGMFRWVILQLQYLRGLKLEADVRSRLGKLPKELREIYEDTYAQSMSSYEKGAKVVTEAALKLLLCLDKHLSTQDFLLALTYCQNESIEVSHEELIDLCFNLIILDKETNVFRFAHLSVREFLESNPGWSMEDNHSVTAEFCLRYLCADRTLRRYPNISFETKLSDHRKANMDLFDAAQWKRDLMLERIVRPSDRTDDTFSYRPWDLSIWNNGGEGLDKYVMIYWLGHVMKSKPHVKQSKGKQNNVRLLCRTFMMDDDGQVAHSYTCWAAMMLLYLLKSGPFYQGNPRVEPDEPDFQEAPMYDITNPDYIFAACFLELSEILESRMEKDPGLLKKRSLHQPHGLTLLEWASFRGLLPSVKTLVRLGALEGNSGCEALRQAIRGKQVDVVRFLIEQDINIFNHEGGNEGLHMRSEITNALARTPLHEAVVQDDKAIIRLLLRNSALSSSNSVDRRTSILKLAVENGSTNIVPLLLDHSAEGRNSFHRAYMINASKMHKAVRTRNKQDLSSILSGWPDHLDAHLQLRIALREAIRNRDFDCARQLLATGVNPNPVFDEPSCENLEHSIQQRTATWEYYDKLHPDYKHCEMLEILLAHGTDPDIFPVPDYEDGSLLCKAVDGGFEILVQWLINTKVNINALDISGHSGMTALHTAVYKDQASTARYLVVEGADVNVKGQKVDHYRVPGLSWTWKPGFTALDLAEWSGNKGLQDFLILHGAISGYDNILPLNWRDSLLLKRS